MAGFAEYVKNNYRVKEAKDTTKERSGGDFTHREEISTSIGQNGELIIANKKSSISQLDQVTQSIDVLKKKVLTSSRNKELWKLYQLNDITKKWLNNNESWYRNDLQDIQTFGQEEYEQLANEYETSVLQNESPRIPDATSENTYGTWPSMEILIPFYEAGKAAKIKDKEQQFRRGEGVKPEIFTQLQHGGGIKHSDYMLGTPQTIEAGNKLLSLQEDIVDRREKMTEAYKVIEDGYGLSEDEERLVMPMLRRLSDAIQAEKKLKLNNNPPFEGL